MTILKGLEKYPAIYDVPLTLLTQGRKRERLEKRTKKKGMKEWQRSREHGVIIVIIN